MRLNIQKHSSVIIITCLLQSLSVANEQQTGILKVLIQDTYFAVATVLF